MLLLLLPWLLLEQRPADLLLLQGDEAVEVEKCSWEGRRLHGLNQGISGPHADSQTREKSWARWVQAVSGAPSADMELDGQCPRT